MHTTTRPYTPAFALHSLQHRRSAAIVAAVLTPLLVWAIAVPVLGVDLTVQTGSTARAVSPLQVAGVSLVVSLLGWALLVILERSTRRARTVWTGVAGGVLLLSLAGPLMSATSTSGAATLVMMHIGLAVVLIQLLAATASEPHV